MKSVLIFLLIISLVISTRIDEDHGTSFEPVIPEPKSRFAMLQDVQLLANGLLHLGRGLKDFAIKTKGQMDGIFQKLNIFDRSFSEISQQTNEIKEEEEQLRKTTARLQTNNEEIRNASLELNSKMQILSQEKIQLQDKVERLEEKLTELFQTLLEIQEPEEISSLKNVVEQQDNHLQNLLKIVQNQHAQLAKQQEQIQDLKEKSINPTFQDGAQLLLSAKEDETRNIKLNATSEIQYYEGNATDCSGIYNRGERSNGIYSINPRGSKAFNVYCEMKTESSWTVIQNRSNGSQDFNQTWDDYINGFGNLDGEFWLGLHKMYSIVGHADYILRMELEDWRANKRYIEYTLTMGGPETDYAVLLFRIAGNIPYALPEQKELKFLTEDHGNNTERNISCPESESGGWWYSGCEETNLNGKYIWPNSKGRLEKRKRGLYWKPQKGRPYLLKSTKLMIHPTDFENFD
ncbi:angiopoietin-related protein 3 [Anolis carolinensis]|uniref:angiopoietin-related protein 3 n=1 Tax=Anolis carolinensis TaxID=28377 RepID=UPI0004629DAB|nr:PREDICTED: angiopoietin-related protein 3 [Anolis carolinensis]|eukprot:XP_008107539.1 PREDICTED: angiopoietin-related protein 3 [Anolis carolinensis]